MLILVEWTVGNSLYGPGYDDMPPPKTSEQALYIYVSESLRKALNSLKADSRLKSAKKAPRMTYRKLMRRMIEEVSASDKLEAAVRSYFLDHNSRPADSNQTIKIRICQDEETLALASALAFRIRGTGNISEVCRLIIRYYVDHSLVHGLVSSLKAESNKIVVAADQAKAMVVPFVESPRISLMRRGYGDHREKTKYIATSFYLDTETVDLLAEFVQRMHVKSIAFTSQLIEQYLADDIRFKILKDSDVLLEDPPSSKSSVVKRFNFTKETNALLEDLCVNVLASSNKSAMIRALIKVEAGLQGIRGKRRTKRIHAPKRAVGGK
jgi:hypothetical protein